ncbi:MAG TPA: hypothetical protein VM240_10500 [Verrucomicrobiae bacterium]|nr:hypothetical protein [Verrucomicrobiae bacterium]
MQTTSQPIWINAPEVRRPLAALLILACITLLTGGSFLLLTSAPGWLSGLVGMALFVIVVFCVRVLLGVLERWMDSASMPGES